jgi:hypothetical protein
MSWLIAAASFEAHSQVVQATDDIKDAGSPVLSMEMEDM